MEIKKLFKNKNFSFNGIYEFKNKFSSSENQTNYIFSKKWKDFPKTKKKNINFSNYDYYAPSNAKRYSKKEFINLLRKFNLKIDFLYEAPECFSGRFFN